MSVAITTHPGTRSSAPGTSAESLRDQWFAAEQSVRGESFWAGTGRRFLSNKTAVAATAILLLLVLACVAAPVLTSQDPLAGIPSQRLLNIGTSGHLLGTDELGRDMLTRILYGGRLSLVAGFAPTVFAMIIGTIIGTTSGMSRGAVGTGLMRTMDMLYAFPAILLAIAVGASLGPGLLNTIIAVTIVYIPPIARVAESATRRVVTKEYVEAARLSGASMLRIVRSQILPNVLNDIIVYASGLVGVAMIIAASLSFLGLGSQPPAPEWGYMLNSLRGAIYSVPLVAIVPGIFIFLASVTFNMASDGLREAMDTRL